MKSTTIKHVTVLPENAYEEQMEQIVEPFLRNVCQSGYLLVSDEERHALYYEVYPHSVSKGTIVISYGFTESCLKYHEMVYYFLQQGYQAAIIDHRGHGRSFRQIEDVSIVHVEHFSNYVDDLHLFTEKIVKPLAGEKPLYLYGHSMGGCIAAIYLEQYPDVFNKAVLNAPMLGLNMGPFPAWMARAFCDLKILCGKGKERLFMQSAFNAKEVFEDSSSDSRARFAYYHKLRCADISYQTSSASYHWGREAINAGSFLLRKKHAKKIRIPVLLFTAGNETLVNTKNHRVFIGRIGNGRQIVVPGVKHEIYRAGNEVLERYLGEIFDFLEEKNSSTD